MIQVENLKKIYKLSKKHKNREKTNKKVKIAVDDVSFKAQNGEIFGLLGPNGAGKTTTLRCIATLIKPTDGKIIVNNYDVEENPEQVRKEIGFLTNELKLDTHFTPKYTMYYFGRLYGMTKKEIDLRIEEMFTRFKINDFMNTRIEELSTGMKQKLSIAVSLIHNPSVIIFDEPTNGLDIITAKSVTDYLVEMKGQGKLIIISTHIMSVAEKLCDNIGILLDGKIKSQGTLDSICSNTMTDDLEDAFFKLYSQTQNGGNLHV
ncbi:MAG: ABC transporter ATP-binding protein [Eubacteriaceae bacterium]